MKVSTDRLEPTDFQPEEIERTVQILRPDDEPLTLVRGGASIDLPAPLFQFIAEAMHKVQDGRTVVAVTEDETVTTQQAADILGISRPTVVKLLEEDRIPYRKVRRHRRISIVDLNRYQAQRAQSSRKLLDDLFNGIVSDGAYE